MEEEHEANLAADIQRTLTAMSDLIHTQMAPVAERTGKSQHALLIKRYREILYDCTTDFKKTSTAVARRRETLELFRNANGTKDGSSSTTTTTSSASTTTERDPAMEQLLRERGAIGNSIKSASSVLGQASEIHETLRSQGQSLRSVGGKTVAIAAHVPGLNQLIDRIRRRRGRDDMIVSGVIAFCILFTLWYVLG